MLSDQDGPPLDAVALEILIGLLPFAFITTTIEMVEGSSWATIFAPA